MAYNGFSKDAAQRQPGFFDDALLDIVIQDSHHNVELQKLVDMTAHTLFEQPVHMTVSAQAERAFLNSYQRPIILRLLNNRWVLFLMGTAMLCILLLSYFHAPKNTPDKHAAVVVPVRAEMTHSDTNQSIARTKPGPDVPVPQKLDARKATHVEQRPYQPVRELVHLSYSGQKQKDSAYAVLDESKARFVEGPGLEMGTYGFDLLRYGLLCNYYEGVAGGQNSIMNLPLYVGKPFQKGFEHMYYLSAYYAQNPATDHALLPKKSFRRPVFEANRLTYFFHNGIRAMSVPDAMAYHITLRDEPDSNALADYFSLPEHQDLLQPFYIAKTEVDNNAYREFLSWVKDYNGYKDLSLEEVFQKNLADEAFVYAFHVVNHEVTAHFGKNTVNVMPDQNRWTMDFPYAYNEPLNRFYLQHPAYGIYPVTGVNYWQALAYCDWLTWLWQKNLDQQHIPYEVTFDLPYAYERELAAEEVLRQNHYLFPSDQPIEELYCNLMLAKGADRLLRSSLGIGYVASMKGENDRLSTDSHILTFPTDESKTESNASDILNLEGNVSEWCKDNYADGYTTFYHRFMQNIQKQSGDHPESTKLFLDLHAYYDEVYNHKDGKMVAGANWYDHRLGYGNQDLNNALWAKVFIDPDSAHCTLGFRYVMRVKRKDDAKMRKKVRFLGHALPLMDYTMVDDVYHKKTGVVVKPDGFEFVPMGTLPDGKSVQAFFAKTTEVSNFEWMLFLNDLIEYGRDEDLQICLPDDSMWAYKMRYETQKDLADYKAIFKGFEQLCFPKSCVKANGWKDIPLTTFAMMPVTGIRKEAAVLFAKWLSDVYQGEAASQMAVRIPYDAEWLAMASAYGQKSPYPWGGPYTRDHEGRFLAYFNWMSVKIPDSTRLAETVMPVMYFPPNDYGLYDLGGNAAEMIEDKAYTRGGSWNSIREMVKNASTEAWDGQASDRVGFRVVITYLGKPQ